MTPEETAAAIDRAVSANWPAQLDWLQRLVRFPSRRGQEGSCQDWIASEFARRGWSVDRYTLAEVEMSHLPGFSPVMDTDYDRAVQVVATVRAPAGSPADPPAGRSLVLQGHVDVVPEGPRDMWTHPPFEPTVRDGWLYGRGAGDMKAGVSAMVFAMDALRSAGLEPAADVLVQTVTEEECTGNGALSTLARGYRADACLIPEPTDNTITRAHVGVMWFRLRVRGVPVHVAYAQTGSNAIMSAYALIGAVSRYTAALNERARSHEWFAAVEDPIKFNPGVIRGGDWGSSTPAWCEVDCRIGLLPGTDLADARRELEAVVTEAARTDAFLSNNPPEIVWNGFQADGFVQPPGTEAEATLAGAHAAVFGRPLEARLSTAVNDTRFYGLYGGMSALCYGHRGELSHGFDERCELERVRQTTAVIARFIATWCGTRPLRAPA